MRLPIITALATAMVVTASWPADAQTRSRSQRAEAYPGERYIRGDRPRTRITVRRPRTFLDPGTEVLPLSQPDLDYATPPLWYPTRIWDTTGSRRSPLPGAFPDYGHLP
jgi:hypothetical protein